MFLPFFVCGGVGGILEVCVCVGGGGAGGLPEAVFFLFLCVGVLEGYLQFACVCVCGVCWRDTWSILFSFFCVGGVLQGDLKHVLFFSFFVWGGCWRDT